MSKFYITTPIYYVNDKPHIGTAYTTIAADVLARWHRGQGDDVHFITGTAEHGDKITGSAESAGKSIQVFSDENAAHFKKAWSALNIEHDDFIRTSEDRHAKSVKKFFERLKESGKIYEGEYEGLYCVGHEAFMKESELDEQGNCPDHKTKPEKVKESNWFFKLSDYENILKEKITSGEFSVQPKSKEKEILSFIEHGLEDIAISRQSVSNALPLPWNDSQTIYVWLDELWSYYTASDNNWPANVHLIGKDIIKFHCIIWPALLEAIGEPWPKKVFAHGFFTVDGQKMSKSLGNVIDPVELAEEYGADALRYFILRDIPFGNDGDFSQQRLKDRYNADLANGLGNLVSRTLNMIEQYIPDFDGQGSAPAAINQKLSDADQLIEKLSFDKALQNIWEAINWADELIEQKKPWQLAKEGKDTEVKETLSQIFAALTGINEKIAPFMPDTHEQLTKLLEARPIKKPSVPLFIRK